ncbi:MAG: hypothetical protein KC910_25415 [Candidatus Eremiobacteraeota bacterium]|nr:hypothetical protein [Candidatus Eremiobacteraeota bacterium]
MARQAERQGELKLFGQLVEQGLAKSKAEPLYHFCFLSAAHRYRRATADLPTPAELERDFGAALDELAKANQKLPTPPLLLAWVGSDLGPADNRLGGRGTLLYARRSALASAATWRKRRADCRS